MDTPKRAKSLIRGLLERLPARFGHEIALIAGQIV